MNGYKGFNSEFKCMDKQYKENTVFDSTGELQPYFNGLHFCDSPTEVLRYYPLLNVYNEGIRFAEPNIFCKVEALGEIKNANGHNYCTNKLKIFDKIPLAQYIKVLSDYIIDVDNSYGECYANKGELCSDDSINNRIVINTYDKFKMELKAYNTAHVANTGNQVKIIITKFDMTVTNCGTDCDFTFYEDTITFYNEGDHCSITALGNSDIITSTGDFTDIKNNGNACDIKTTGDNTHISCTGNDCFIQVCGSKTDVVCSGTGCAVSGVVGTTIVLSEYQASTGRTITKFFTIDGLEYRENRYYMLKNGEVVYVGL